MLTFDPELAIAIREPPGTGRGFWAGCPSVLDDVARGSVLLTYRLRRPRGSEDDRGYECRIAESGDGIHFDDIWSVHKSQLRSTSMERFNLQRADDGRYLLYTSYEHPDDGRWRIDVIEADAPDAFDVTRARTVLTPAATGTAAVKDPYVKRVGDEWWMFVSTFLTDAGPAPTSLAVSADGGRYEWRGEVFGVGETWDRYQARLSGIVRAGDAFVGFYDGAGSPDDDTEEHLGLAVSADLRSWERVTPDAPWLVSPHATGSVRYLDALERGNELWLYYECARADGSHDLRLSRVAV